MRNPTGKGMEYVRFFYDLPDHPKTQKLRRYLQSKGQKSDEKEIVSSILYLWRGTGRHFTDGLIRDQHDLAQCIAQLCSWEGDPEILKDALVHADWLRVREDGLYVTNWLEKIAFNWWENQKRLAEKRTLGAKRSKRLYDERKTAKEELKRAEKEIRVLRESIESGYSAEIPPPPPPENPNAKDALVTRRKTLDSVRKREDVSNAKIALGNDEKKEPEILLETLVSEEKPLESSDSQSSRDPNAFLRVRNASSRSIEKEKEIESNVKDKDKGEEKRQTAALSPVPHIVGLFLDGLKAKGKELPDESHKARMGKHVKDVLLKNYTLSQIETAIQHWFDSTWVWVTDEVGFNFSAFKKSVDKLVTGPMIPFNKVHSTEEEGRPILNAEGNYNLYNPTRDKGRFRKPITWKNE